MKLVTFIVFDHLICHAHIITTTKGTSDKEYKKKTTLPMMPCDFSVLSVRVRSDRVKVMPS